MITPESKNTCGAADASAPPIEFAVQLFAHLGKAAQRLLQGYPPLCQRLLNDARAAARLRVPAGEPRRDHGEPGHALRCAHSARFCARSSRGMGFVRPGWESTEIIAAV